MSKNTILIRRVGRVRLLLIDSGLGMGSGRYAVVLMDPHGVYLAHLAHYGDGERGEAEGFYQDTLARLG